MLCAYILACLSIHLPTYRLSFTHSLIVGGLLSFFLRFEDRLVQSTTPRINTTVPTYIHPYEPHQGTRLDLTRLHSTQPNSTQFDPTLTTINDLSPPQPTHHIPTYLPPPLPPWRPSSTKPCTPSPPSPSAATTTSAASPNGPSSSSSC